MKFVIVFQNGRFGIVWMTLNYTNCMNHRPLARVGLELLTAAKKDSNCYFETKYTNIILNLEDFSPISAQALDLLCCLICFFHFLSMLLL